MVIKIITVFLWHKIIPTGRVPGTKKQNMATENTKTDKFGAVRHAMSMNDLRDLYKRLENFIADCTRNEVDNNRDAINGVLTLIHKRMLDLQNK